MKYVPLVLVLLAASCAGFPRAKFEISAFGAALSLDTRTLEDHIGSATASFTEAVGLTTGPAAETPASIPASESPQ